MATRGDSKNIIVGAAQVFVADEELDWHTGADDYIFPSTSGGSEKGIPDFVQGEPYADTLEGDNDFAYVGYTNNGLELQFQPDFGEVQVDQLLDVAKLFKQGMKVTLGTTMVEATLENLLVAIAATNDVETDTNTKTLELFSGELGECPLERAIVAVGPGSGDCAAGTNVERVYVANRALSIDNVSVAAKRDAATEFAVSFRLLPASNGAYGKIVDRTVGVAAT